MKNASFLILLLFPFSLLSQEIITPVLLEKSSLFQLVDTLNPNYLISSQQEIIKQRNLALKNIPTNEIGLAFFQKDTTTIKQYDKVEIGIELPENLNLQIQNFIRSGSGLNPFNPDEISIEAEFFASPSKYLGNISYTNYPKNKFKWYSKIYGFYYEEFHVKKNDEIYKHGSWIKKTTPYKFRLRFTPQRAGTYYCRIHLYLKKEYIGTLQQFSFNCNPNAVNGYLCQVSENNRYLQFENGNLFYGIGQNIPIADMPEGIMPYGSSKFRVQPPKGFELQREYIDDLAKNGGNFVRIMHGEWSDAIEWEKLGNYSMNMNFAWEFDKTVELCEENKIYILWLQQVHTAFMARNPFNNDDLAWPNNPYHLELGLEKPEEFFKDTIALKYYKQKIRYMMSRWGYSPYIAAIQPMSEMNEMAGNLTDLPAHHPYFSDLNFRQEVANWFEEIKNYIQKDLGYPFLIGSSFTGDVGAHVENDPIMKIADFNDMHPYAQSRNRNLAGRFGCINITPGYGLFKRYQKPVILGEIGVWDTEQLNPCHENEFHNDIWGTAFLGGWTIGVHWHNWEDVWNKKLRKNFIGFSHFIDNTRFTDEEWTPYRWPEKNLNDSIYSIKRNDFFENLYLVADKKLFRYQKAVGWVHNRSAYWYNYPESDCEKEETNKKTKENKGKTYYRPNDDDAILFTKYSGNENREKRITRVDDLQNWRTFTIDWYDTVTGEIITTTKEYHGIGKMKVLIPDEINETLYQDLGYKIY